MSKSVKGTYLRKRLAKTAVTLLVMSSMMALSTYAPGGTAFAASGAWKDITDGGSLNGPGGIAATSGGSSGRSSHSNTSGSGNTTGSSPLWITSPTVIPTGQPNQSFSRALTASGGTEPYTWNILAGTLPPGLTLDEITGVISGTTGSSKPEIVTVEVRDTSGETQTKQVVVDALPQGARELVWQATDLHAEYVPVVVRSDAGTPTTYMSIWYVMQLLDKLSVGNTWNGTTWSIGLQSSTPNG